MYSGRSVAVVVPAYNEQDLIGSMLGSIPSFVDVVYAVDDASIDGTLQVARAAAGRDERIRVHAHGDNRGVGRAIVSGFRSALDDGLDVIAVMDGDGQMHPEDLAPLLDALVSGNADMAKGNRLGGLSPLGPMPLARFVGNHVLSVMTRAASGLPRPVDAQCGYVAIRANALRLLPLDLLYPRYGFPNDLYLRAIECGLRVESVPVRAIYGTEVSGIRAHVAVPRILGLLSGAVFRRLSRRPEPIVHRPLEADE